ncbi:MAG: hypothetical protein A2277_06700 [Desulfobacterales bacterium RIFOXYA12_FULL_46_15]|nr:MAG: hypothetical protein A2277_06700 [Desulfobacterales bacterium RIFOXYA12_FULL_46_15]
MILYIIGFIVVFLLVLASGFPVGFGLGFLAMGILTCYENFDMAMVTGIQKAHTALNSSVLVAVPLFILAAQLISETGMGKRLFDAAKAFLGRLKAGLGISTIVSSGIFSAMTGSSYVAASTMGLIAIPELRRAKYPDALTSAAITAGGSLGAVIPPSIILIIYGYLTDESIGKLFAAGMVPGVLLIALYSLGMVLCSGSIGKGGVAPEPDGVPEVEEKVLTKWKALKGSFWGLMAPVIILGGIYLGIFTASEAAGVAVIYCTFVGFFIYKSLNLKKFWGILKSAANVSAMVAVIVMGGAMLGYVIIFGRIPHQILEIIIAKDLNPIFLLVIVNIVLFVMGMFLEVLALVYLAIPLLYPVVLHMGWDNVWFAVIFLLNVNMALITPPMGGVLFVVSMIGGIPINTVIKGAILPIIILILVLILVVVFPQLATWLPGFV